MAANFPASRASDRSAPVRQARTRSRFCSIWRWKLAAWRSKKSTASWPRRLSGTKTAKHWTQAAPGGILLRARWKTGSSRVPRSGVLPRAG